MAKPRKVTSTHDRLQEVVDGSRLIKMGLRTGDPESVGAGWERIREARGGNFAKKLFDNFKAMFEAEASQSGGSENKG